MEGRRRQGWGGDGQGQGTGGDPRKEGRRECPGPSFLKAERRLWEESTLGAACTLHPASLPSQSQAMSPLQTSPASSVLLGTHRSGPGTHGDVRGSRGRHGAASFRELFRDVCTGMARMYVFWCICGVTGSCRWHRKFPSSILPQRNILHHRRSVRKPENQHRHDGHGWSRWLIVYCQGSTSTIQVWTCSLSPKISLIPSRLLPVSLPMAITAAFSIWGALPLGGCYVRGLQLGPSEIGWWLLLPLGTMPLRSIQVAPSRLYSCFISERGSVVWMDHSLCIASAFEFPVSLLQISPP